MHMLAELRANESWTLTVQRPAEFRVTIDRTGLSTLGLDLQYAPNGSSLLVCGVSDGPIQAGAVRITGVCSGCPRMVQKPRREEG